MSKCSRCGYSDCPDYFNEAEVFWVDEYRAELCSDCLGKLERDDDEKQGFMIDVFHHESGE